MRMLPFLKVSESRYGVWLMNTGLHATIERVIGGLKSLRAGGDIDESKIPIGIISMENWEWPQGVALFALYRYYKETGDREILDYLEGWYGAKLRSGDLPPVNINTLCPMLTLCCLEEETSRVDYLKLCEQWADYALHELPRTEEGGLQHLVSGNYPNTGELWDDTLYMAVLFMAKMGQRLNRQDLLEECERQFLVHLKYLTDVKTGLFYHGWTFEGNHHFAGALWARGNSWYTAGLVDYVELSRVTPGVRLFLISSLQRQIRALADCQAEDGMWHTLLHDPGSYKETSATAAFAYGILKAVRLGLVEKRFAEAGKRAFRAVLERIDGQGIVQGVSYGTGMGRDLDYYRKIPQCPMPYGQSMALLMLVEGLKHDAAAGLGGECEIYAGKAREENP